MDNPMTPSTVGTRHRTKTNKTKNTKTTKISNTELTKNPG